MTLKKMADIKKESAIVKLIIMLGGRKKMGITTEYLATQICTPLKTEICRYAVCAVFLFLIFRKRNRYIILVQCIWLHGYLGTLLNGDQATWLLIFVAT